MILERMTGLVYNFMTERQKTNLNLLLRVQGGGVGRGYIPRVSKAPLSRNEMIFRVF